MRGMSKLCGINLICIQKTVVDYNLAVCRYTKIPICPYSHEYSHQFIFNLFFYFFNCFFLLKPKLKTPKNKNKNKNER